MTTNLTLPLPSPTFVIPHESAKEPELASRLTYIIEDNAKLAAELQGILELDKNRNLLRCSWLNKQISDLNSEDVKKLRIELWRFYQKLITWVAVAKFLKVEISNPGYVQQILNDLWYLLDTNPYVRIRTKGYLDSSQRELSLEELNTYKRVLFEFFNRQSRIGG